MFSLALLVIFFVVPSISYGQTRISSVFPKEPYIAIGSDIQMICKNFTRLDERHRRFIWRLNDSRLDESLYQTLNSSCVALNLRNVSFITANVVCLSDPGDVMMGGSYIRTYNKPTNLSCVLKHGGPLTCRWDHMMSEQKVTFTVSLKCPSCTEPAFKSDNCYSESTSCEFKGIPALSKNSSVTVTASTSHWNITSESYTFLPMHIIVFEPPESSVTVFSSLLRFAWSKPEYFEKFIIHCQIHLTKTLRGQKQEYVVDKTMGADHVTSGVEVEVDSCSNTTMCIRWAFHHAPWSEWSAENTFLSKLNISSVRLNLWRSIRAANTSRDREVLVVWKGIPESCNWNGNYKLGFAPDLSSSMLLSVDQRSVATQRHTHTLFLGVQAYRVDLAFTFNSTELPSESVYVPAVGENLPQVSDLSVSSHGGDIHLSWSTEPSMPVRRYMVDWTSDRLLYSWRETQDSNTTLTDLRNCTLNIITITPLFDSKTGIGVEYGLIFSHTGAISLISDVLKFDLEGHMQEDVLSSCFPRKVKRPVQDSELDTESLIIGGTVIIILVISIGLCCAIQYRRLMGKKVPNPAVSSLREWPPSGFHKPFNNPPECETNCERIYQCDMTSMLDYTDDHSHMQDTDCSQPSSQPSSSQTDSLNSSYSSGFSWQVEDGGPLVPAPLSSLSLQECFPDHRRESTGSSDTSTMPSLERAEQSCPMMSPYCSQNPFKHLGRGEGKAGWSSREQSQGKPMKLSEQSRMTSPLTKPLTPYVTSDLIQQGLDW